MNLAPIKTDLLTVGQGVRHNSRGRTGNIMERGNGKALIHWLFEEDGKLIVNGSRGMGVKTWMRFEDLELLGEPVSLETAKQEFREYKEAQSAKAN